MVPSTEAYSPQFQDHLRHPRNAGRLEHPDASSRSFNPACGDELLLDLQIRDGRISEVRFQATGCGAALAAGSAVTELLQGCPLDEVAGRITPEAVEAALGGLPGQRRHAAVLASQCSRLVARQAIGAQ